jgi:hypothetical protein
VKKIHTLCAALCILTCLVAIGCGEKHKGLVVAPEETTPWWKIDDCSGNRPYTIQNKWSVLSPVFRFSNTLPSDLRAISEYSASAWNSVGSKLSIKVNRTLFNSIAKKDGVNLISYESLSGSKLGETRTWLNSNGQIVEADIILNKNQPLKVGESDVYFDVYSVLTHEFGHFCGLTHVDDRSHTMYPSMPMGSIIYRTLCEGDELGLKRLYP